MLNRMSQFATKTFIFWMLVAAIIGFVFPSQMAILGGFVPYLLGIVMLGMGMTIDQKISRLYYNHLNPLLLG